MFKSNWFSISIRIKPIADLLNANGSFEPVGFSLIFQKLIRELILSDIAMTIEIGLIGTLSLSLIGK